MTPRETGLDACVDNRRFHLILMPTEGCNFRCTYCYEEFRNGRMRPEIVRAVGSLISRRAPALEHLRLSWFGGEPLLARDIVEEIQDHALSLAAAYPAMTLSSDMTTNGSCLSPAVLSRLVDLGITTYQITFDGAAEEHDHKRVLATGGGTFAAVWGNLLASRSVARDFEIIVRLHVDRRSLRTMPDFLRRFDDEFEGDPRYTLFVRPLSRLGGKRDGEIEAPGAGAEARLDALLRERGQRLHRPSRGEGGPIRVCYAAKGNSFVVRADGRLNKCTVALEDPANQVGVLRADGTVEVDGGRVARWMRGLWSGDPSALQCPR